MRPITDVIAELASCLAVTNIAVQTDVSTIPPVLPAIVIGAPQLLFEAVQVEPTLMRIPISIVVDANPADRALPELLALVPLVAAAIDQSAGAALQAIPGSYGLAGTTQLPAYDITIEVPLT